MSSLRLLQRRKSNDPTINCNKKSIKKCACYNRWVKWNHLKNKEVDLYDQFMKQSGNYSITDFQDDFFHIISFHSNAYQLLSQHCKLTKCPSIQINYGPSRRSNIKHEDNHRELFMTMIHQQHCQIYHDNTSDTFRRFIIDNYPNYKKNGLRYVHNGHDDDNEMMENEVKNKQSNELPIYQTGEMLNFAEKEKKDYVWCKTENLKQEWLEYGISIEAFNDAIMIAKEKEKSDFIRKTFVSNEDPEKEISLSRILTLYQYTANDRLQQELCRISRKTRHDHDSLKKFKRELGKFGHTYKLLMTTVEIFGDDVNDCTDYEVKFRGINVLVKFNSSTIDCYTPTSTTSSRLIAANFSDGTGCILELHPHDLMKGYYLNMKVFSRYPEEDEFLFYGQHSHLKVMYVHHPIRFDHKICYGAFTLLERSMSKPKKLMITQDKKERKISLRNLTTRSDPKEEMKKKHDPYNYKNELTKLLKKYVKYNKKSRNDKFVEESSMSGQSKETEIKDQEEKPNIEEEKYRDEEEKEEQKSMELYIGETGSNVTNQIEMQQLEHIICQTMKENKKNRLFLNHILIQCINEVFGEMKIENIIKIFPLTQEIHIDFDIDQRFIINFVLHDDKQQSELRKIRVNAPFQNKYANLASKLHSFDNPLLWEMFHGKNYVDWKKIMSV